MADGGQSKQRENRAFRGAHVGDDVSHIWDRNAKGRVTRVEIPLVYVKFNGSDKEQVMDRDELVVITKQEDDLPEMPGYEREQRQ